MQSPTPSVRDIVLVGGGHSHVQVVKRFGMRPQPGVRLTLVSSDLQSPYSGMLPGCIAGFYTPEEIHINLDRLCHFAGARFVQADVNGLDLAGQQVTLEERPPLRYDVLSINCGAVPVAPDPDMVTVKPISRFLPAWAELQARIQGGETLTLVGGGAGGVELAFAIRTALPACRLRLVGAELLPGHNERMRELAAAELARRSIDWVQARVETCAAGRLQTSSGAVLETDHLLWVTDVQAPAWIAGTGLATDERGFIKVEPTLRSVSHENVFAAGDVAHLVGQERPKSGVYAVREGPVLARNLRHAALGEGLRTYRAQARHLALIGCGDRTAIATRGRWASSGAFWWWLKQRIDRRFMRKFNELAFMEDAGFGLPEGFAAELPDEAMRCGGCGAKLAADPLRRVLARLPVQSSDQLDLGIGDDAALIKSSGTGTLLTVDGFRAMISDPYLFGRIAAHHSLNDIFAMGAKPVAALALVTVPLMAEALMEEDLFQLLSGVTAVLNDHGVALAGGHSAEGAELSLGLAVTGTAAGGELTKGGAAIGDRLLLTKPLGTGVILASAMRGVADIASVEAAVCAMDTSNARAAEILRDHGATALTDVTGFGFIGHLGEMLRAANLGAQVDVAAVPVLTGACELIGRVQSSLQTANELALHDFDMRRRTYLDPHVRILADPQTSGGLLAAVPDAAADGTLAALRDAGYVAAEVGRVTAPDVWLLA